MRLRKLIGEIGAKGEADRLLRLAEAEFGRWVPSGYLVKGCGEKGESAVTPSIAILNPSETTTDRHGMYVAYLFAADKSTVTLTLNQAVGEMAEHLGRAGARLVLARQASLIRAALAPKDIADLDIGFDLHAATALSMDCECANIVSRTYSLKKLPAESEMAADLQRFIRLYDLALRARQVAGRDGRLDLITRARQAEASEPEVIAATDPPVDEPRPADRKQRALAGTVTRRGILAAIVAVPIAYAAPKAIASRNNRVEPQMQLQLPAWTAPVFTVDVSQHDWRRRGGNLDWDAIRDAGIAGMCARATYGDPSGYQWPTHHFGSFARAAKEAGFGLRGGYHNLVRGDQPSINRQVDWLRRELDTHDATWAMLDVERYGELVSSGMWPRWEDVLRFHDRWAEVEARVLVGYIPQWNWSQHLGQPDLREFSGPLIASNYPRQANEDFKQLYDKIGSNDGRGWTAYGNRTPDGWQYSSRARVPGASHICDINAWRITFEQLNLLLTDKHLRTPVANA